MKIKDGEKKRENSTIKGKQNDTARQKETGGVQECKQKWEKSQLTTKRTEKHNTNNQANTSLEESIGKQMCPWFRCQCKHKNNI